MHLIQALQIQQPQVLQIDREGREPALLFGLRKAEHAARSGLHCMIHERRRRRRLHMLRPLWYDYEGKKLPQDYSAKMTHEVTL